MKNFFKGIFKNKYPGRVNGDDNATSGVYAGPDYFEKKKKPMGKVYAGPGFMDRNNTKCVYAGPEMMEKRRRASEMEDVYAGPPMDEPEDEPSPDQMPVMQPVYAGPAPDGPMFDPKMMAAYAGPVTNDQNQFMMAYAGPMQMNQPQGMFSMMDAMKAAQDGKDHSMTMEQTAAEKEDDPKKYKFCPSCGSKADHAAIFCIECGTDLKNVPVIGEDEEKEE